MNTNSLSWRTPPTDLSLPPNEVHIWRVDLEATPEVVQRCGAVLTPTERARAQRYVFEHHRRRWIVSRATLRLLLSRYLDTEPTLFEFDLNEFGKPSLATPYKEMNIEFNLSHSAEIALYAFTRERLVGVDVEYMRADLDFDGMARHSFSLQEQHVLRNLVGEEKRRTFFRGWTCKEAYAKALGKGFSQAFDQFSVSLLPSQPFALVQQNEDARELTRWSFLELDAAPGYAAAAVVEGHECQAKCWQLSLVG
jgi:4'-phosphopantetheinyl transferase